MDLRALIFMPALVGAVVFGFVFLLFACHYYLTVLEGAAAGADQVAWVSEPITDNFWKFWYLGFLVGAWLGPALIVGRVLAGAESSWVQFAVPLGVLWLCYPVSQLSSLSASSIWYPLVPDVFVRMAQKPVLVLQFLVLSAVTLAVFAVGFRWAFQTAGEWHLLFLGTPLMVVAGLVYASLLGRLAFALRFTRGLFAARAGKQKKKPAGGAADPAEVTEDKPRPRRKQPRDLPPVTTPDEGGLTGYDVRFDDDPVLRKRKRVRAEADDGHDAVAEPPPGPDPGGQVPDERPRRGRIDEAEDTAAYGVRQAEVVSGTQLPDEALKPSAEEARLISRDGRPKKPRRVWGVGVVKFLGQPGTVSAVVILSGLGAVVGVMVRVARAYNPVGE